MVGLNGLLDLAALLLAALDVGAAEKELLVRACAGTVVNSVRVVVPCVCRPFERCPPYRRVCCSRPPVASFAWDAVGRVPFVPVGMILLDCVAARWVPDTTPFCLGRSVFCVVIDSHLSELEPEIVLDGRIRLVGPVTICGVVCCVAVS